VTRNHAAGQLSLLPSIELAPGPIEGTWTVHCYTCPYEHTWRLHDTAERFLVNHRNLIHNGRDGL
jgi:hypothetical protein